MIIQKRIQPLQNATLLGNVFLLKPPVVLIISTIKKY